jgi:hypothetical protein
MSQYVRDSSMGGVIRYIDDKSFNTKKAEKRLDGNLSRFNKVDLSELPCDLEDDGMPLKNEFLEDIRLKEEKQKIKEKTILENHKEETYKTFVKDLLESSDDIFDSKGDDISDKEFLKNEMRLD